MGFFDKLSDIVSTTGKELNKKAKDLVSTSKLESQINLEEEKIHNIYVQIGTEYYEQYKNDPVSPFVKLCEQITASKNTIEELKKRDAATERASALPILWCIRIDRGCILPILWYKDAGGQGRRSCAGGQGSSRRHRRESR